MDIDKATTLYHSDFHSPSGAAYLDEVHNIRTRLETINVLYVYGGLDIVSREELLTDPALKWIHGFYNWMCHVESEATEGKITLYEPGATSLDLQQRAERIAQLLSELPDHFPQL